VLNTEIEFWVRRCGRHYLGKEPAVVAYSFKKRFVEPIRRGLDKGPWQPGMKRQTIRGDRRRHARPGEQLQHYCGMRTQGCFLIGRAVCREIRAIWIAFDGQVSIATKGIIKDAKSLDAFAAADGFSDWAEMREFWNVEHGFLRFGGKIIYWEPDT
jgi:hypothetical protein